MGADTIWGDIAPQGGASAGSGGALDALSFNVFGEPVGQGSMRAVVAGGKAVVVHSAPKALGDWRLRIASEAQVAMARVGAQMLQSACEVSAVFMFARPQAHYTSKGVLREAFWSPWMATTPDIDKLVRALLDALTGVVFVDDRQVAALDITKQYVPRGDNIGVAIRIVPLVESWQPLASRALGAEGGGDEVF